jgi:hypothetical protein
MGREVKCTCAFNHDGVCSKDVCPLVLGAWAEKGLDAEIERLRHVKVLFT